MSRTFIMTLDTDWAPDFVLEDVFTRLLTKGAHATIFVTNPSRALPTGSADIELGWHPNFLTGSTQGSTVAEVCAYLDALVPGARSIRTHALHQSTFLFRELATLAPSLRYDSSLYLPGQAHVTPFSIPVGQGRRWRRYPIVWEDDFSLTGVDTMPDRLENLSCRGACVVDFHPIHVYLNSADMRAYEALKRKGPLQRMGPGDLEPWRNKGEGVGTLFDRALQMMAFDVNLAEYAERDGR